MGPEVEIKVAEFFTKLDKKVATALLFKEVFFKTVTKIRILLIQNLLPKPLKIVQFGHTGHKSSLNSSRHVKVNVLERKTYVMCGR